MITPANLRILRLFAKEEAHICFSGFGGCVYHRFGKFPASRAPAAVAVCRFGQTYGFAGECGGVACADNGGGIGLAGDVFGRSCGIVGDHGRAAGKSLDLSHAVAFGVGGIDKYVGRGIKDGHACRRRYVAESFDSDAEFSGFSWGKAGYPHAIAGRQTMSQLNEVVQPFGRSPDRGCGQYGRSA